MRPRIAVNVAQHKIINSLKTWWDFFFVWLCVAVYLMCGPRQLFFQVGPETPKGWTTLAMVRQQANFVESNFTWSSISSSVSERNTYFLLIRQEPPLHVKSFFLSGPLPLPYPWELSLFTDHKSQCRFSQGYPPVVVATSALVTSFTSSFWPKGVMWGASVRGMQPPWQPSLAWAALGWQKELEAHRG